MCRRVAVALLFAVAPLLFAAGSDSPSRPPEKGCRWERFADAALGLSAWVQRCDFGFRKIDFLARGHSLAIRYSDGGAPDAVIDVFDMKAGEDARATIHRVFAAATPQRIAKRCVLASYGGMTSRLPAGVERFSYVPDEQYAAELKAKASPDEVGDPPCGDMGDSPDGIQYFEVHRGASRVLFVRVGQDTPLFDEQTLKIVNAK